MLAHTSAEIDSCLTNIFGIFTATARLEIYAFLFKFVRTCFVGTAENIAEFWSGFRVEVNVIVEEGLFQLTVD